MTNPPEATGGSANAESAGSAGRRLIFWLGQALALEREAADIPRETVAGTLRKSAKKIERVEGGEDGESVEEQSYFDIDRVVAAYAYELGLDDPRELWIQALELWYKHGDVPDFSDDLRTGEKRFGRPIRGEVRRRKPAPAEPEERLSAMRRQKRNRGAQ